MSEPEWNENNLFKLAEALGGMARDLGAVLSSVSDEKLRGTLVDSMASIRRVSSSLYSIDLLYDPEHARQFARHSEALRQLAASMHGAVGELSQANKHTATRLDEHMQELEKIAEMSSEADLSERIGATLAHVRGMASEMYDSLNAVSSRVARATENIAALERELDAARQRALTDALTRIHSRAALGERLEAAVREGNAAGPWSFLLLDVDHFRLVNEVHGTIVGDALLYKVARAIEETVPQEEGRCFLARYGGEAFALHIARADLAEATRVAEEVRQRIGTTRWQPQGTNDVVRVTVSIGLTQYQAGDAAEAVLRRATRALFDAKKAGRNRIVVG